MKRCSKCGGEKPLAEFNRNKAQSDGYANQCKPCKREDERRGRAKNPEFTKQKDAARNKRYYDRNREEENARCKTYDAASRPKIRERKRSKRASDPDHARSLDREAYARRSGDFLTKNAKRRAAKLQRTIALSPEHELAIKRLYAFAKYISEKTKIPHHVDHIVPLQGKEMTGLHVPWNLQVIAASNNLAKSNKVDYSRALPTCMDRADA